MIFKHDLCNQQIFLDCRAEEKVIAKPVFE